MRLIDADALKRHYAWWNDENKEIFDSIIDMQETLYPVTHGHWELVTDNRGQHFECQYCGAWRYHKSQRYCGNCGIKMDEVEK